jgi:hypothetical protein
MTEDKTVDEATNAESTHSVAAWDAKTAAAAATEAPPQAEGAPAGDEDEPEDVPEGTPTPSIPTLGDDEPKQG